MKTFHEAWLEFAEIAGIEKAADEPMVFKAFCFAWDAAMKKAIQTTDQIFKDLV